MMINLLLSHLTGQLPERTPGRFVAEPYVPRNVLSEMKGKGGREKDNFTSAGSSGGVSQTALEGSEGGLQGGAGGGVTLGCQC